MDRNEIRELILSTGHDDEKMLNALWELYDLKVKSESGYSYWYNGYTVTPNSNDVLLCKFEEP